MRCSFHFHQVTILIRLENNQTLLVLNLLGWPKRLFFFIDMYNIGFGMTLSPTCQLFSIAWPKSFHIYTFCILPCLFQLDTAIVKIFYCLKFVFINIFKFNNNAFTYLKCKSHSIFKVVLSGLKSNSLFGQPKTGLKN
jgi:hypothetical protein